MRATSVRSGVLFYKSIERVALFELMFLHKPIRSVRICISSDQSKSEYSRLEREWLRAMESLDRKVLAARGTSLGTPIKTLREQTIRNIILAISVFFSSCPGGDSTLIRRVCASGVSSLPPCSGVENP